MSYKDQLDPSPRNPDLKRIKGLVICGDKKCENNL